MNLKLITAFLLLLVHIVSAQDYNKPAFVSGKKMMIQGDSLHLSFNIHTKASAIPGCQNLIVTPQVIGEGKMHIFPWVLVNGKNQYRMFRRWLKLHKPAAEANNLYMHVRIKNNIDTMLQYKVATVYEQWMNHATLQVKCELHTCNEKPFIFALSVDTINHDTPKSAFYHPKPLVTYVEPTRETAFINKEERISIDFQIGKSKIIPEYKNNQTKLARLGDIISRACNQHDSKEMMITALLIEGYASPEGPYALNEKLSDERMRSLKEYICNNYDVPETMMQTSIVAEDWKGLKDGIMTSRSKHSDDILSVLNANYSHEVQKKKLREIGEGEAWRYLTGNIFPYLRRVELRCDFAIRDYSHEGAKQRYDQGEDPECMSAWELWCLAEAYEQGCDKFNEIIDMMVRVHPSDTAANINAAAVMIERGDLHSAARCLEKAGNDPRAWNNRGVLHMLNGNLQQAAELLHQAETVNPDETRHNLNELIKMNEK